ncbi:acyl-CoA N-acyltransferase [Aspergillus pseudoustus]|uniref:Acyl-CoA N-acyltransferase n=1 Tax=Aspergillus pseudoustus TaxID=1810923 RepID=A0ABR4JXX0_9EURO
MASEQSQRFKIHVVTDADFPALFSELWYSFENPYQGILRLFFPILNDDRVTSLKTCTEGQLEEYHQQQPNVTWVTIVDTENSDRIAAAAKWYFYDENPFNEEEQHEADWYPEGVGREFATLAARQFEAPRETMARNKHAFLHIAFTHPSYRRRGLGKMFMEWGVRIADERGLECWLDATEFGVPLYELFGFHAICMNRVKPVPERDLSPEEREEWEHYEKTLLPIDATVMWRPPKGVFIQGETVVPVMSK